MFVSEEDFFESNFDYEDEPMENFKKAVEVLYSSNAKAEELSERISDGEIVDETEGRLIIDNLVYAQRYVREFATALNAVVNILPFNGSKEDYISSMCKQVRG